MTLSRLDESFFLCLFDDFKAQADLLKNVRLRPQVLYTLCCAPLPQQQKYVCATLRKFAQCIARKTHVTKKWLCAEIEWPLKAPGSIEELAHLENVFDVLDLYLWLR